MLAGWLVGRWVGWCWLVGGLGRWVGSWVAGWMVGSLGG